MNSLFRTFSSSATRLLIWAVLAVAAACGPPAGESRTVANDSASWHLAEPPSLHIGATGADGHELDRVYSGLVTQNGSVVVGNSGSGELRFFDLRGRLSRVAGRKGAGPGEFQSINWIRRFRGDSLLVFDLRSQRFSVWSEAGSFGRSFHIQPMLAFARPVAAFPDATVLMSVENQYDPRKGPGLVRDEIHLFTVTPTGQRATEVGRFAGAEWLLYNDASSFRATRHPLGKSAFVEAANDEIVYAASDTPRLDVYDRAGRLVRVIQIPVATRVLGTAEIDSILGEIGDQGERRAIRRHLASTRTRVESPAITDLRVDSRGDLWVQTPSSARGLSRWVVLSTSGKVLGTLVLPNAHMPLDVQESQVLLREMVSDGVQRVALRGVVR